MGVYLYLYVCVFMYLYVHLHLWTIPSSSAPSNVHSATHESASWAGQLLGPMCTSTEQQLTFVIKLCEDSWTAV